MQRIFILHMTSVQFNAGRFSKKCHTNALLTSFFCHDRPLHFPRLLQSQLAGKYWNFQSNTKAVAIHIDLGIERS